MSRPAEYKPRPFAAYQRDIQNNQLARGSDLTNFQPGSRLSTLTDGIALTLARRDMETYNGFLWAIRQQNYNSFNFARKPGTPASGILQIDNVGHTETLIFEPFTVDLFGQQFRTLNTTILAPDETSTTVEAVAVEPGAAGNINTAAIDTAEGKGTVSVSMPTGGRLWNPSAFTGGTDQESDESREARFQIHIRSFGRSTKAGILSGALSVVGVVGAVVTVNVDPVSGLPETGRINVYVSDGSSQPGPAILAEVRKTIEGVDEDENYPGYAAAGTRLFVGAIDIHPVHVSYRLTLIQDSPLDDAAAIQTANAAAILYCNRLPIGQDVLRATLQATILSAHPDFYRVEITSPAADESVPANALPRIG
ncbi:MAG: baseplate J/gp47 family protein, partial [Leptospirales bacterium]